MVYALMVMRIGTKNLASEYVHVEMADKMGRKGGNSLPFGIVKSEI